MPQIITHTKRLSLPGQSITTTRTQTIDGVIALTTNVPNAATDDIIEIAIDESQLKAFAIMATVNMTFKTNNTSPPPGDTITLVANVAQFWWLGETPKLITTDATVGYATNGSGSDGTLFIIAAQDVNESS